MELNEYVIRVTTKFDYFSRNNEEKLEFRRKLAEKLNTKFPVNLEPWNEEKVGIKIRNLKKTMKVQPLVLPTPTETKLTPRQAFFQNWHTTLLNSSKTGAIYQHSGNRGTFHEGLVKDFLTHTLLTPAIAIGTGEIFESTGKQLDLVLYNQFIPVFRAPMSNISCFQAHSVIAVIEVKTTLTNSDMEDVVKAAESLPDHQFLVFAYSSQSTLAKIKTDNYPNNLLAIFSLEHGSILQDSDGHWTQILPFETQPLQLFYDLLCELFSDYGQRITFNPFNLMPQDNLVESLENVLCCNTKGTFKIYSMGC